MIKYTINIVELPDGNVCTTMVPDQSTATKQELHVASVMDISINAACEYIIKKRQSGECFAAKDVALVAKYTEQKLTKMMNEHLSR